MSSDEDWEPWYGELLAAQAAGDDEGVLRVLRDLWRFDFHENRARERSRWSGLFELLLGLLRAPSAPLQGSAYHYAKVMLTSELGPPYDTHSIADRQANLRRRVTELLVVLGDLVLQGVLSPLDAADDLVHAEDLADLGPQPEVIEWLGALAVSDEARLAAQLAYADGRAPWSESRQRLFSLLDHPDNLVRAVAAREIGRRYCDAQEAGMAPFADVVREITAKEIERPGIAGPLLSSWYVDDMAGFAEKAGVDVEEWIATILARRRSPEPDTLPCSNGIDFFAHEIFGGSAAWIPKLLDLGHIHLAAEAATEIDDRIDELEPVLRELASRPEPEIARAAAWHLGYHHRCVHPDGERRGFVRRGAVPGAEVLVNLTGETDLNAAYAATLYPSDDAFFDDAGAWRAIDRVLPEALRGVAVPYGIPGDGGSPGEYVTTGAASTRFSSGAIVTVRGDVGARRWDRVRIIWHGPRGSWQPLP